LNCPDGNPRIVVGSTVGGLVGTAVLVLLVARAFGYDFLTKQYTITNFYSLAEQKFQVWTYIDSKFIPGLVDAAVGYHVDRSSDAYDVA
jgi:hypothetical protein